MAKKKLKPSEDDDEVETLSGEEEEAEEQISDDSPSEEEDDLLTPVIIPLATKPKTPVKHSVASGSKNLTAVTPMELSPFKSGSKRSSEISSKEMHAKRSKKVPEESEKKPLFQRLWNEEDEISLLQGMIDFKFETEKSPYEDMDGFYEFIKKPISFDASKIQVADKIRYLRKKYMGKVHKDVESLPKAHDNDCLKLSKYIWGSHGMALTTNVKRSEKKIGSVKPRGKEVDKHDGSLKKKKKVDSLEANGDKEEEDRGVLVNGGKVEVDKEVLVNGGDSKSVGVVRASDWFEDSFLVGYIAGLGVGEGFVKQKWSMVAVETKKRMEEKWKLLQAKEMELVLKKTDFMREVGSVIAEAS